MENEIKGFHAHVYYDDDKSREAAAEIRAYAEQNFDVRMGRWRDKPVGPHPKPMFQMAFEPEVFAAILPWLMLNHGELAILIHPETGEHVPDHRDFALWLGEKLELDIAFLEAGNTKA
jgi:aromatic ring-cleaving dioxygenase